MYIPAFVSAVMGLGPQLVFTHSCPFVM